MMNRGALAELRRHAERDFNRRPLSAKGKFDAPERDEDILKPVRVNEARRDGRDELRKRLSAKGGRLRRRRRRLRRDPRWRR